MSLVEGLIDAEGVLTHRRRLAELDETVNETEGPLLRDEVEDFLGCQQGINPCP